MEGMRALATAMGCALAACAPHVPDEAPALSDTIVVGESTVRLEYQARDAAAARRVAEALVKALPCAERWGQLRVPVTVVLHPSHAALEEAVHRDGFAWLRAWARFDTIDLQSPRTWNLIFPPTLAEIEELLAHELTHCVMYQRAGTASSWPYKGIPLWFREGMASVTAGQGYKRGGPEPLWAFYARTTAGRGRRRARRWEAEAARGEAYCSAAVTPSRIPSRCTRATRTSCTAPPTTPSSSCSTGTGPSTCSGCWRRWATGTASRPPSARRSGSPPTRSRRSSAVTSRGGVGR